MIRRFCSSVSASEAATSNDASIRRRGLVGVLAARARRARGAHGDLPQRDRGAGAHGHRIVHGVEMMTCVQLVKPCRGLVHLAGLPCYRARRQGRRLEVGR